MRRLRTATFNPSAPSGLAITQHPTLYSVVAILRNNSLSVEVFNSCWSRQDADLGIPAASLICRRVAIPPGETCRRGRYCSNGANPRGPSSCCGKFDQRYGGGDPQLTGVYQAATDCRTAGDGRLFGYAATQALTGDMIGYVPSRAWTYTAQLAGSAGTTVAYDPQGNGITSSSHSSTGIGSTSPFGHDYGCTGLRKRTATSPTASPLERSVGQRRAPLSPRTRCSSVVRNPLGSGRFWLK